MGEKMSILTTYKNLSLEDQLRYGHISSVVDSLERYINHRIPTGGFLEAVLSNNFFESIGRADFNNLRNIQLVAEYIYMNVPSIAYGSKEKVNKWLDSEGSL